MGTTLSINGGLNASLKTLSSPACIGMWHVFLWNVFGVGRSSAMLQDNVSFLGTFLSSVAATLGAGEEMLRMNTIPGGQW